MINSDTMDDYKPFLIAVGSSGCYSSGISYAQSFDTKKEYGLYVKHSPFTFRPRVKNIITQEWIDQNGKIISDAAELNDSVWKTFGHKQWPHIPGWRKRKTHKAHVDYMKTWLSSRYKWLDKEINRIEEDK